jgi:hypothetical protein
MSRSRFIVLSLALLCAAATARSQTRSFLKTGEFLPTYYEAGRGEYLVSDNKNFYAMIPYTGRFTIYKGSGPRETYGKLWEIPAYKCCVNFAIMQSDGNFVNYFGRDPSTNEGFVWGTQVLGAGGLFFVILQGDGNLCVYKGTGPGDNRGLVWCSNTATTITWAGGGRQIVNASGSVISYDGARLPAWVLSVSMQAPDPSRRWTFSSDTTLRWSANNACLTLNPTNGATGLTVCDGSANQKGWWYQASDKTIRKSSYPAGCLTAGIAPGYANSTPTPNYPATPCAGGPASTWTLN